MSLRNNAILSAVVLSLVLLGCSNAKVAPKDMEKSQASFDQANDALKSKNYAEALLLLNDSIASRGLSADDSAEAFLQRGICNVELGNLDEGLADIETAAPGVGDVSRIHMAKHRYWTKRSNPSKAQEELAAANQIIEGL